LHANWKRIYRVYRDEGLSVRRRKRKRIAVPLTGSPFCARG
jgi:hypothetical protein